jgi:hypothetical protein
VKQWKQRRAAWSGGLILKETMPTHEGVPRTLGDDSTTGGDSDNDRQHGQCTKHVRAPVEEKRQTGRWARVKFLNLKQKPNMQCFDLLETLASKP